MVFQVGDTVGLYQITDKLGQGGMATVFKGHHVKLKRDVAIKVLHTAFKEDPNFLERFEREAQIVAQLEHPHIIPIHDYAEHQGNPYLVMRFIEGETLKARLKRGSLSLNETICIMDSVAQALTYAHEKGVLHRDIKPSNIMLDRAQVPYIADFGLARIAQAGESTLSQDVMLGTPQYISPEQAKGDYDLGPRTDIYSLGVVLYEILVGRVPFNADTPYAIVHDHIYKPLPLPTTINPEVPGEVERVLQRALAKEADARYASAIDMIADFKVAVQDAGMTELSTAHYRPSSSAALSTAMTEAPDIIKPPPITTSSPPPTPAGIPSPITYESHYVLAQQETNRRRANLWILGGFGLLLLTCVASLFIIAHAVSDPDSRPWNVSDTVDAADNFRDEAPPPEDFKNMTRQELFDWLRQVPISLEKLAQFDTNQPERNNQDKALVNIIRAVSELDAPPEIVAEIAQTLETENNGIIAYLLYLDMFSTYNELPPHLRAQAGMYLFNKTKENPIPALILTNHYVLWQNNASPANIVNALALLQTEDANLFEQANNQLRAITRDNENAEFYLVHGLYYLKIDQTENALNDWNEAATFKESPDWVVEIANQLITQYLPTAS